MNQDNGGIPMSGFARRVWVAAAAVVLAGGGAFAQPALDKAAAQVQAKERQLSDEVAEAVRTAPGVAKVDANKAARTLREVALKVDIAAITEKKRAELLKQLDDATLAIKGTVPVDPKADLIKDRVARGEKDKKQADAATAEAKEVNEGIAAYAKAREDRRDADAKKQLAALTAKYPDNPAVLILGTSDGTADVLADARFIAAESSRRWTKALNDVQLSALPPIGDIEYPKDFKEKGDRLKARNAPKLSAEEQKLLKALDTPITKGLAGAPFQEAVSLLSTAIDQKIYVDKASLEGLGVNLDDKVEVPGGVTARSALRVMLQSKGLTFVLRDNVIQVVTIESAKKQCVTRAYDVRDLVGANGFYTSPLVWGPLAEAQQVTANARIIIDAIQQGIDPASWAANGGVGSISFHYPTMSLIVRAPSEVQADLYRKMNK